MYQFYNAHPKGLKVRDCVKRAISKGFNKDYMEVSRELNTLKRKLGVNCYNNKKVWKTYLEDKQAFKISFPAKKGYPRMNGHTFTKKYKEGSYILSMAGHLSVCINGVIYDTWDCREKCIYTAYKIINRETKKLIDVKMNVEELGNYIIKKSSNFQKNWNKLELIELINNYSPIELSELINKIKKIYTDRFNDLNRIWKYWLIISTIDTIKIIKDNKLSINK
ncbi:hypothetical protein KHQ81_15860 (plasmid) [Mycoplasmatota bacterium]|nr:hypothetical protein KHQ81_15860 [Mycoplasmatota bacterium]